MALNAGKDNADGIVLVGSYRSGQLDWIEKNGVYNWPVRDGDEFAPESFGKIGELWLYADAKATRHVFAAEFVGKATQAEFLAEHPTYVKQIGAPKHAAYYVFKATRVDYPPELSSQTVVARTADFGRRCAKVKKAVEQFKRDGEFAPLACYLPEELGTVPRKQLRVCESAVQLEFFFQMGIDVKKDIPFLPVKNPTFTFIDLFAGIGGFRIAMQNCGGKCVFTSEFDVNNEGGMKWRQSA